MSCTFGFIGLTKLGRENAPRCHEIFVGSQKYSFISASSESQIVENGSANFAVIAF